MTRFRKNIIIDLDPLVEVTPGLWIRTSLVTS